MNWMAIYGFRGGKPMKVLQCQFMLAALTWQKWRQQMNQLVDEVRACNSFEELKSWADNHYCLFSTNSGIPDEIDKKWKELNGNK